MLRREIHRELGGDLLTGVWGKMLIDKRLLFSKTATSAAPSTVPGSDDEQGVQSNSLAGNFYRGSLLVTAEVKQKIINNR